MSQMLLNGLIRVFKKLNPDEGRNLAHQITSSMNDSLLKQQQGWRCPDDARLLLGNLATKLTPIPSILALPWQAYHAAQLGVELDSSSVLEAILATVPKEYVVDMTHYPKSFIAPHAGSLLSYMGSMICDAEEEIWVVNPYWSSEGVKRLHQSFAGRPIKIRRAIVVTARDLERDHLKGFEAFTRLLEGFGVEVMRYEPNVLSDSAAPLLHAKVTIADRKRAYIGSANLSENGLTRSIEMGVGLHGGVVAGITEWFNAILHFCDPI